MEEQARADAEQQPPPAPGDRAEARGGTRNLSTFPGAAFPRSRLDAVSASLNPPSPVLPESVGNQTAILLRRLGAGDAAAANRLFELLYSELHGRARRALGQGAHTLQPTAVVHEVWLRLSQGEPIQAGDRQHFLRIATRAIRAVLIDHARRGRTARRGGCGERLPLDDAILAWDADGTLDPLVLDELLGRLRRRDQSLADLVELRFFGGLTEVETAEVLGLSRRQTQHAWKLARAFLQRELERDAGG